jgi:hypothetical protein
VLFFGRVQTQSINLNRSYDLMILNKSSAWSEADIRSFLTASTIPMRIATSTDSYPTLCSVWYMFDAQEGDLLCVSHENSQLITDLIVNNKCSFEIAPNEPPYFGVRGKANITLTKENTRETLTMLLQRFLGGTESGLAKWLLSRSEEEYVVRLKPVQITSWDYSDRMD